MGWQRKLSVLVVDDSQSFLKSFKAVLEQKDCIVQTTSTIGDACQMALNNVFHVVFIDCILLSQHGIDLAKKIRELLGDSLEIVMMSGIIAGESITSFTDLNLFEFFKKPPSRMKLDFILDKARDRYISSDSGNFLKNVFSEPFSNDLFLQFLIGLNRISTTKFFPVLSGIFKSKEDLTLEIVLPDNTSSQIFFHKGVIAGFENNKKNLLEDLLSKNLITREDIYRLEKNISNNRDIIFQNLIAEGLLSPWQMHELQLQKLLEFMKSISKQEEVTVKAKLFKSKNNYMEVGQDALADKIFPFLENLPQKDLEQVFDKNTLISGFKIKSKKDSIEYLAPVKPFAEQIKEGMRIPAIQSQMSLDEKKCRIYILYVLLKGETYCSESGSGILTDSYLLKRYKKIYGFFNKTSPEEIFKIMGNAKKITSSDLDTIKNIYRNFLKHNHIDKFSMDLSPNVKKSINNVTIRLKQIYNEISKTTEQKKEDEKEKGMRKTIELSKNKQLCQKLMEEKKYKQAFSIIKDISFKNLRKSTDWMLLYIWLNEKAPHCGVDKEAVREFIVSIGVVKMSLMQNPVYFYIQGLSFLKKNQRDKALMFFKRSKELDISFQPAYEEYKKVSMEEKSVKTGIFKYFSKKKKIIA